VDGAWEYDDAHHPVGLDWDGSELRLTGWGWPEPGPRVAPERAWTAAVDALGRLRFVEWIEAPGIVWEAWLDGEDLVVAGELQTDARSDGRLAWVDGSGIERRALTYGGAGHDRFYGGAAVEGDGHVLVGHLGTGADATWVVRVGPDGAVRWEHTYPGGCCWDRATSVTRLADGFAVAGVRDDGPPSGSIVARVLRLDEAGEVVWDRAYGDPGGDGARAITRLPGGDLIVGGHRDWDGWVARLAADTGDVMWEHTVSGIGGDLRLHALSVSDAGWIAAGGFSALSRDAGHVVWILDPDGDVLTTLEVTEPGRTLQRVRALPDGRLALVGDRFDDATGVSRGLWLQILTCAPASP